MDGEAGVLEGDHFLLPAPGTGPVAGGRGRRAGLSVSGGDAGFQTPVCLRLRVRLTRHVIPSVLVDSVSGLGPGESAFLGSSPAVCCWSGSRAVRRKLRGNS